MAFNNLPAEMNQNIASFVGSDQDFVNFGAICKTTYHEVLQCPILWKKRFACVFDMTSHMSGKDLVELYKKRQGLLHSDISFAPGQSHRLGLRYLNLICKLINGEPLSLRTFTPGITLSESLNLDVIKQATVKSHLLNTVVASSIRGGKPLLKMMAIQLALYHIALDLELQIPVHPSFEAQRAVYQTSAHAPVFQKSYSVVNVEWLLLAGHFFRYHLFCEYEGTLFHEYTALDKKEYPKGWTTKLEPGLKKLGRKWKGAYAYLLSGDIQAIRNGPSPNDVFVDNLDSQDGLQTMFLEFDDPNMPAWPNHFEIRLHTVPNGIKFVPRQRSSISTPKAARFMASGSDNNSAFRASGYVHELPLQHSIPGFQRITMMKYYTKSMRPPRPAHVFPAVHDETHIWAYEGVVLPGGNIMLGRWWLANNMANADVAESGPFLFWCID
ncbi:MAG: hypothetical protein M1819_000143 [Sarea resinae]|nr:MAG: hypothetical protein M1819_000143 [Sarea resinae]